MRSSPNGARGGATRSSCRRRKRLSELLTHLYVLIPVLDNDKHYFVGDEEVEKLLRHGDAWLGAHPERVLIAERYLKYRPHLAQAALARLAEENDPDPDATEAAHAQEEELVERPLSLNQQRLGTVVGALKATGARSVLDLGCGEGNLLRELLREKQFERIVGMDRLDARFADRRGPAEAGPHDGASACEAGADAGVADVPG